MTPHASFQAVRPVKLHFICLDAMPWGPDLARFASEHGLTRIPTFNQGTYTYPSMLARFTGRLASELVPRGIGSKTSRLDRYYRWLEDPALSLLTSLAGRGWEVVICNDLDGAFRAYLPKQVPPPEILHGSQQARAEWLRDCHPTIRFVASNPDGPGDFRAWESQRARDSFYAREREHIQERQGSAAVSRLVSTNMEYFHDAHYYPRPGLDEESARRWTMQWLRLWRWDEQDSVFVVFADHGYDCKRMAPPPDHLTWSLVRDNHADRTWPTVLAGADCHALACDLADPGYVPSSHHARVPSSVGDPARVFLLEDARGRLSPYESTTAAAITVSRWGDGGEPEEVTQLSWFGPWAHIAAFRAPVDDPGDFRRIYVSWKNPTLVKLREALIEHIPWIDDVRGGPIRAAHAGLQFRRRRRADRVAAARAG